MHQGACGSQMMALGPLELGSHLKWIMGTKIYILYRYSLSVLNGEAISSAPLSFQRASFVFD